MTPGEQLSSAKDSCGWGHGEWGAQLSCQLLKHKEQEAASVQREDLEGVPQGPPLPALVPLRFFCFVAEAKGTG